MNIIEQKQNERFDNTIQNAIHFFEEEIGEGRIKANKHSTKWMGFEDYEQKFEYIMNNKYWCQQWSLYLLGSLNHFIWEEEVRNN